MEPAIRKYFRHAPLAWTSNDSRWLFDECRNKENGHFTQIARDVSFKVGCSISQYLKPGDWYTTYYVCDYAVTNVVGGQIYEEGPTASKCKTGTNPKYPGLCSENEKYDDSSYINYP